MPPADSHFRAHFANDGGENRVTIEAIALVQLAGIHIGSLVAGTIDEERRLF